MAISTNSISAISNIGRFVAYPPAIWGYIIHVLYQRQGNYTPPPNSHPALPLNDESGSNNHVTCVLKSNYALTK